MDGSNESAEQTCLRLAERQYGLLRREQALGHGLSVNALEWCLHISRWRVALPSVYRVEGSPHTWHQQLKAACLWAGPTVAASHRAAAALWKLARFPEGPVEVSTTRDLRASGPLTVHRVRWLRSGDFGSVLGLPVTTPTRTLVDLCAVADPSTVRSAVDECLRRKLTSLDRLGAALARAGSGRGVSALRELLENYLGGEAPTESELEALVFDLLEEAGVPLPTKQRPVFVRSRLRRLDFLYPEPKVVIEADGYATHSDPIAFEKDAERRNALTSRGYRVLHFTYQALKERPDELVDDVQRALGWAGHAHR